MSQLAPNIQQLLATSLERTNDCVGIFDAQDTLIYCNEAMASMYAQPLDAVIGQSFSKLVEYCYLYNKGLVIEANSIHEWLVYANQKRRQSPFRNFEIDLHDGRWFLATERVIDNDFIFFYATDITEKKRTEKQLQVASQELFKLATIDSLTDCHNRRYFLEMANIELQRGARANSDCSILMIDLDNFKSLNDNYGHQGGDITLAQSAKSIKENLRPYDIFGRIGGEEFAVLLPNTSLDTAKDIGERIRQTLEALTISYLTHQINITTSVGVANSANSELSLEQLMSFADKNLYRAKHSGRNKVIA
ncbi:diguanylate cyclase [Psychrobium sp. MM17-31]|uniref:GGDEF domain-containing protein n=1 Tax=Psychrobium sp. MM17-31 TaxID=2917758 RepID=UPI001EF55C13|nr:sensor domain-containing diguanylate cyclase [Psychrobium sp. MM17-31]MCG7530575.1 diguanylate cyclase [Psychrobium sp. MM17-31]